MEKTELEKKVHRCEVAIRNLCRQNRTLYHNVYAARFRADRNLLREAKLRRQAMQWAATANKIGQINLRRIGRIINRVPRGKNIVFLNPREHQLLMTALVRLRAKGKKSRKDASRFYRAVKGK